MPVYVSSFCFIGNPVYLSDEYRAEFKTLVETVEQN